uniref:Uncharacterized protein n=1 Tax=Romanomermis culicivorax TaxID=13658 RepID=A0A915KHH6_ROMCU
MLYILQELQVKMKFLIILLLCICQLTQFSIAQDPEDFDDDDGQQQENPIIHVVYHTDNAVHQEQLINFESD